MSLIALDMQRSFREAIDHCRPWIEAALENSVRSHTFEDVKALILRGDAHLWANDDGCIVTSFNTFPQSKVLQLWLCGGDFEKVASEYGDKIEACAEQNGCDQIIVNGRRGWEKRLKDRGYQLAAVILTKEI